MIYFISDIHLGFFDRETERKREDLLILLLNRIASNAEKIYLLGDIFDYWFDYKQVIPRNFFRVLAKLSELRRNGIVIEFLKGNHDFGHFNFFEEELGITVHENDIEREHHGKRFYLSHGDGKNPNDRGYLLLKKVLRNRWSLKLYLWLHPDFGIKLASGSSKQSRTYTDSKENMDDEPMRDFAFRKIDDGFDYVIMGHRHKLETTKYKTGEYINLGDWFKVPHYGVFDGKEFLLKEVSTTE